jgi:hypothetical protein
MSEEIIQAHPAARRSALLVLAIVVGAAVGVYFWAWPWFTERLCQGAPEERLRYLGWLMFGLFLPCFIFAGYFALLGVRIGRSGQYPPPGMKVITDTKILRGSAAARMRGWLMAMAGLLVMLGLIGGIWLPWMFSQRFLSRYTG